MEREEYEALYGRLFRPMVRFVVSRGINFEIAEELVNDVWMNFWKIRCGPEIQDIEAWMRRAIFNRIIDYRRHINICKENPGEDLEDLAARTTSVFVKPDLDASLDIEALVIRSDLSNPEREAWDLLLEGFTVEESAEIQQIGRDGAMKRVARARVKLRRKFSIYFRR